MGKSALLGHAVAQAPDMAVLRARGVESESTLAFAGLGDLFRPITERIDLLAAPQAAHCERALALGPPVASDRFAVCAATLSLLAAAAEAQPSWPLWTTSSGSTRRRRRLSSSPPDGSNPRVLRCCSQCGTGRRAHSSRPGSTSSASTGLDRDAAHQLLASGGGPAVSPELADRLVRETAGNPLALIELPRLLSPEQIAGEAPLDERLPVGPAVERAFGRRLDRLPRRPVRR